MLQLMGLGACLVHVMDDGSEKPVTYASHTLTKPEKAYAQIKRESLAIIYDIRRFHQFLYSHPFTLVTPLQDLQKQARYVSLTIAAARMQR